MRILRGGVVSNRVGYHIVHIRRLVKKNEFPAPVRLGPQSVGWIEEEVDEWIENKISERDALGER